MTQLRNWRMFKDALFIDQVYFLHVLDPSYRDPKNWENKKTTNSKQSLYFKELGNDN